MIRTIRFLHSLIGDDCTVLPEDEPLALIALKASIMNYSALPNITNCDSPKLIINSVALDVCLVIQTGTNYNCYINTNHYTIVTPSEYLLHTLIIIYCANYGVSNNINTHDTV